MKLLWSIIITVTILIIGVFILWGYSMKQGADILEFDHPSRDIKHSMEKNIFIDSLDIISKDTIKTNKFEQIDIYPTSSWIEKMTYWKSGSLILDSLGLYSDTVMLIVNFKDYKKGQSTKTSNFGKSIIEFKNSLNEKESVYIDDNIVQIYFKMPIGQISDTIRLQSTDGQRIILKKTVMITAPNKSTY